MANEEQSNEEQSKEPQWTIQSISDNSALIIYEAETTYVIGATADTLILKALEGGNVAEEASVCYSQENRSLTSSVTVDNSTTRLQEAFDDGCVSLRYFRDNELVLEEETSVMAGLSAPAREIATDRQVYEKSVHLRRLVEKLRDDSFFREQVMRSISQSADPSASEPISLCEKACDRCANWEWLPHSCVICHFCSWQIAPSPH